MKTKLTAIISGGQSGADTGGLYAGRELGLSTGGIAPKDWKTEAGPAPWLEEYGLSESQSPDYVDRTEDNVKMSDGTVIFGRRSVGSNKTEELCRIHGKPCWWIPFPPPEEPFIERVHFPKWLILNKIKILNVAGNRESRNLGISKFVKEFLIGAMR